MTRGDVVLVVAQGDLRKPRPAVVVQSRELGETTSTVVVCPMSSEPGQPARLRPPVEPTGDNGLRIRSHIMTDKVTAMRRDRIRAVIGRLDRDAVARLDRALLVVLGLAG